MVQAPMPPSTAYQTVTASRMADTMLCDRRASSPAAGGGAVTEWSERKRDGNTNSHTTSTKCQYRENTSALAWRPRS